MVIATTTESLKIDVGEGIEQVVREIFEDIETGGDNAILAATSGAVPAGELRRLVSVEAHYDGTATQAGVTTARNSSNGDAYDTILDTGAANAEDSLYAPATDIYLLPGDAVTVTCPAGGAGVVAAVTIITETVTKR